LTSWKDTISLFFQAEPESQNKLPIPQTSVLDTVFKVFAYTFCSRSYLRRKTTTTL